MNYKKMLSSLRAQRDWWDVPRSTLATWLQKSSASHFSRIEAGKGVPSLKLAFAFQVLFGVPVDKLFSDIYADVEAETMPSLALAHEGLLQTTHPRDLRNRELLELALQRAVNRLTAEGV